MGEISIDVTSRKIVEAQDVVYGGDPRKDLAGHTVHDPLFLVSLRTGSKEIDAEFSETHYVDELMGQYEQAQRPQIVPTRSKQRRQNVGIV